MKKLLIILLLMCPFVVSFGQQNSEISPKWRLNLAGGAAYMTASTKDAEKAMQFIGIDPKVAKDYMNSYKWGWQGNGDIHYLFNQYWGVGAKYVFFTTSGELKGIDLDIGDGVHSVHGDIKEKLYINYVGPSVYTQRFLNKNNTWLMSSLLSIGYAHYREEAVTLGSSRLLTGNSFGAYFEIGAEYFVAKNISIGANMAFLGSTFKKLTLDDGVRKTTMDLADQKENVSQFDLSLGIRIYR